MKKFIIPALLVFSSLAVSAQSKQTQEKTITLKLTAYEVNVILNSLGELKLATSLDTYFDVRTQAIKQLTPSDSTLIDSIAKATLSDTLKVKPAVKKAKSK